MRSTLSGRPRISMRFAIRISKGITLSLLLSYSVVKEPTSAKGRQSCQTLTSVSSGWVSPFVKPTRLMRTRLPLEYCCWKRSAGANCFAACRDRGVYVPAARLSTTANQDCQLRAAVDYSVPRDPAQPARPRRYSSLSCCTTCCADSSYRPFSKDPVPLRDQL